MSCPQTHNCLLTGYGSPRAPSASRGPIPGLLRDWVQIFETPTLILLITHNALVCPFSIKYACLDITNMLLIVSSTLMPSYILITLNYYFINYRRLLYLMWLPSTITFWDRTQMISYQIIGDTVIFREFIIRCYSVW